MFNNKFKNNSTGKTILELKEKNNLNPATKSGKVLD